MRVMPFCENWARLMSRRSDADRLRFFDTYLKACFGNWTPDDDSTDGEFEDYWTIQPVVEERVRKGCAGRSGGRPKGTKSCAPVKNPSENHKNHCLKSDISAFPSAFQGAFQDDENGSDNLANINGIGEELEDNGCGENADDVETGMKSAFPSAFASFIKERNRIEKKKSVEKAHTRKPDDGGSDPSAPPVGAAGPGESSSGAAEVPQPAPTLPGQSAPPPPSPTLPGQSVPSAAAPTSARPPSTHPSLADVRIAAHNLSVPAAFGEYFHAEMTKLGWQARSSAGRMFAVNRANLASILRGWWETEKKHCAARDSSGGAAVPPPPVTGAGRADIPAWTGGAAE